MKICIIEATKIDLQAEEINSHFANVAKYIVETLLAPPNDLY